VTERIVDVLETIEVETKDRPNGRPARLDGRDGLGQPLNKGSSVGESGERTVRASSAKPALSPAPRSTVSLTTLANRRAFVERLTQPSRPSSRAGRPFAVLCLDLDGFKERQR